MELSWVVQFPRCSSSLYWKMHAMINVLSVMDFEWDFLRGGYFIRLTEIWKICKLKCKKLNWILYVNWANWSTWIICERTKKLKTVRFVIRDQRPRYVFGCMGNYLFKAQVGKNWISQIVVQNWFCVHYFTQYAVLECGHSVCMKCLMEWKQSMRKSNLIFRCHICRHHQSKHKYISLEC